MGLDGSQDTPALKSPGPPPSGTDTLVEVAEAHREMAGGTSLHCWQESHLLGSQRP